MQSIDSSSVQIEGVHWLFFLAQCRTAVKLPKVLPFTQFLDAKLEQYLFFSSSRNQASMGLFVIHQAHSLSSSSVDFKTHWFYQFFFPSF